MIFKKLTIGDLVDKYKKYDLRYNCFTGVLYIYEPILVEDFLNLKWDIKRNRIELKDIRVVGRYD